jgi:hypothetical protein
MIASTLNMLISHILNLVIRYLRRPYETFIEGMVRKMVWICEKELMVRVLMKIYQTRTVIAPTTLRIVPCIIIVNIY